MTARGGIYDGLHGDGRPVASAPDHFNQPRPYDLEDPREVRRLIREVNGYLRTCIGEHHGTDRAGRQHALVALAILCGRDVEFVFHKQQ